MDTTFDFDSADINDIDLEDIGSIDDIDLDAFGEIDFDEERPHFRVQTKQFKHALEVARIVSKGDGRDLYTKAICFQVKRSKVIVRSTDFDVYSEYRMDLMNDSNILDDTVVVPTDILVKVARALPANTVIYKDGDEFYIKLYGGDIVLETHRVEEDKYCFSDPVENMAVIESEDLLSVMKDFTPVVTSAQSPLQKMIMFDTDKAVASYIWAILRSNRPFAPFDLQTKDISILKILTALESESLAVKRTKEDVHIQRYVLEGQHFSYAFLAIDKLSQALILENLEEVLSSNTGMYVDMVHFSRIVDVASVLNYSTRLIGLNYTDKGIELTIKTRKDNDPVFFIPGSGDEGIVPLDKEIVLQALPLRVLLRSFAGKASVKLTLSEAGLGISCEDCDAAIHIERN